MKGRRVSIPEGIGEVIETIGDKITVKLDSGETITVASDNVADESSAG